MVSCAGDTGHDIGTAIDQGAEFVMNRKPTYICGHSLGGLLAECVCSLTGRPGAAFGPPGPYTPNMFQNLVTGVKHVGVPFKVVVNEFDMIARAMGRISGWEGSHIVKRSRIKWLKFGKGEGFRARHSIARYTEELKKEITNFFLNRIDSGAFVMYIPDDN